MLKIKRAYRDYIRAFIANDVNAITRARITFKKAASLAIAQLVDEDRLSVRKKKRELDENRKTDIAIEEQEAAERRSKNIGKLGKELRSTMLEYAQSISEYREQMQDLNEILSADDFIQALRERSQQSSMTTLSNEALKNIIDAYDSIEDSMRRVQKQVLNMSKELHVLWTPIRHLPEFMSRMLDEGNRSSKERAKERELFQDTFGKGRLFRHLDRSEYTLKDTARLVREKIQQSREFNKIQKLMDKQQAEETAGVLTKGILKGEPQQAIQDILSVAKNEWNLSRHDLYALQNLIQTTFLQDAGVEAAEDLKLTNAGLQCAVLIRMAQEVNTLEQLERFEDKTDEIVNQWNQDSERFTIRIDRLAEALAEAYDGKKQYVKQSEFLNKVFIEGKVVQNLVDTHLDRVNTLLEYADRLLTPILSTDEISPRASELEAEEDQAQQKAQKLGQEAFEQFDSITDNLKRSIKQELSAFDRQFAKTTLQTSPLPPASQRIGNEIYLPVLQRVSELIATSVAAQLEKYLNFDTIRQEVSPVHFEKVQALYEDTRDIEKSIEPLKAVMAKFYEDGVKILEKRNIDDLFRKIWPQVWALKAGELKNNNVPEEQIQRLNAGLLNRGITVDVPALEEKLKEMYEQLISEAFKEYDQQIGKNLTATLKLVNMWQKTNIRSFARNLV